MCPDDVAYGATVSNQVSQVGIGDRVAKDELDNFKGWTYESESREFNW